MVGCFPNNILRVVHIYTIYKVDRTLTKIMGEKEKKKGYVLVDPELKRQHIRARYREVFYAKDETIKESKKK